MIVGTSISPSASALFRHISASGLLPAGSIMAFEGDSNTGWGYGTGFNWSKAMLMASGGRVWLPPGGHFANPGATVAYSASANSLLDRQATVAAFLSQYPGRQKIVAFQIGTNAENGQLASYPATTELASIIATWKAADPGFVKVWANTLPYNTDESNLARADALNTWLRTPGNVDYLLDVNAVTSPIVRNMGSPNTHYNNAQHADVGQAGAALLATIVDAGTPYDLNASPIYSGATDFASFGALSGTGFSGNYPANWTPSRVSGTGTIVASQTTQEGQPALQIVATGGASGNSTFQIRRVVSGSFAAGEIADIYGKVRIVSASAPIPYLGISEIEGGSHFPISLAAGLDLTPTDLPDVYLYRAYAAAFATSETQLDIRLRCTVAALQDFTFIFSEPEAAIVGSTSNVAPVAVTPPVMGAASVGGTPSRTAGSYTGTPTPSIGFAYYLETGVASGLYDAIASDYVYVTGDIGKRVYVTETATNVAGSATQDSATQTIAAASTLPLWDNTVNFSGQLTYSNSDRTVSNNGTTNGVRYARQALTPGKTSGKWYAKATLSAGAVSRGFGIGTSTVGGSVGGTNGTTRWYWTGASAFTNTGTSAMGTNISTTDGNYEIAFDLDADLIWFKLEGGNWNNNVSADPATGTGGFSISGTAASEIFLIVSHPNNTTASSTLIAGTPPSGFTAL